MKQHQISIVVVAIFALFGAFAAGPGLLKAQDATPEVELVFGARIVEGTCAEVGDIVFELEDVMLAPTGGNSGRHSAHDGRNA